MNNFSRSIFFLIVGFLLAIGFSQVIAAFSEPQPPGTIPPNSNIAEPVNISATSQYKGGALGVGGVFQSDSLAVINGGLIIERRTSTSPGGGCDPSSPEIGRLWLRTTGC